MNNYTQLIVIHNCVYMVIMTYHTLCLYQSIMVYHK